MHGIRTIAVVGAGMAGLAAGRRLHDAGLRVIVFEKSRGVGGRMATRREGSIAFDHGAQFFTARGPAFSTRVEGWEARGIVAHWPAPTLAGRAEGSYVGVPGMTAPARALADGLLIVPERRIDTLTRADGGWRLRDAAGIVSTAGIDRFDAVVLAAPAPQAMALAATGGFVLPETEQATYAPCWSLMLTLARPVAGLPDAFSPEDGALAWIARNASKPGRSALPETLVVHATPDWSRAHLEETPAEVARQLSDRLAQCLHRDPGILTATAHRWRFALVERPAGVPFAWNDEARLGACGDWCLGARVEAAFDSGHALAAHLLGEETPVLARDARS